MEAGSNDQGLFGSRQSAIEELTKAIENNRTDPSAFAHRAVCFAQEGGRERELFSDVKRCIELDFRYANFLTHKAMQFSCLSQIAPLFRLIKALGASIETYKRSIGKFFPKILDDEPLNHSDIDQLEKLLESFHELDWTFYPDSEPDWTFYPDAEPDSQSDSETDSSNNREAAEKNERKQNEQALKWKEKGDKLYEEEQFRVALDCYNRAIELDKSNLELLICRAQVYCDMGKWEKCNNEANNIIILYHSQGEKSQCEPVAKAWKLTGMYLMKLVGPSRISMQAFEEGLRFDVPADVVDDLIRSYNVARKGLGDVGASIAAFQVGNQHQLEDNSVEAIQEFTKAIEYSPEDPLMYAYRALCYAEDDRHEQELISDFKESLELDYRTIEFFLITSQARIARFPTAHLRLLRALSLSEETFRQSAGRIFRKILDRFPLNKCERKRYKELAKHWRKIHLSDVMSRVIEEISSNLEELEHSEVRQS